MSIEKVLPDQQVKSAVVKKARRKRTPHHKQGASSGRWTNEEHRAFLNGLKEFGREWKKVATRIPTRTSAQIRSHAQKYFAKLQREQETINLSSENQGIMMERPPVPTTSSASSLQQQQPLAPSVQKNIERLIADPQAVQREVEHTLLALQERYRQLQAQLEQRRQQQQGRSLGGPQKPMLLQPIAPEEEEEDQVRSVGSRKRSLQEMESSNASSPPQQQQQHDSDDHSSVTTNISASVASLGNEELIALHVLGGALPRNESSASMRELFAASKNAFKQHQQDSSSPASSQRSSSKKIESPKQDNNNSSSSNKNK